MEPLESETDDGRGNEVEGERNELSIASDFSTVERRMGELESLIKRGALYIE
jgi:hypothetical protein